MTTQSTKSTKRKRRNDRRTWKIVLEVLVQHRDELNAEVNDYLGITVSELYARVAAHPEVKPRLEQLPNLRAKVRQVCQQLRDAGLVEHVGRGAWKLPDAS